MPEGHSIHRLARQLGDLFAGQRLRVTSPQGRFDAGAAVLDGRVLTRARAHGKHLYLDFAAPGDPGDVVVMRSHLGIYGAWSFAGDEQFAAASSIGAPRRVGERESGSAEEPAVAYDDAGRVVPEPPVGAVRARLAGDHGWADLRGPALCTVETPEEARAAEAKLGPDPLDPEADPEPFLRAAGESRRAIGVLLMEQNVVSGIGNIFRAESLFRRGVNPMTPGTSLTREDLLGLWDENVTLMAVGVRVGRIITTDPADRPGIPDTEAWPEHANYVYHRHGQPCLRCGTTVLKRDLNGRGLYWCPSCQA
ncbi:Fpg/Nei family DNA glycosylase [Kocuria marina]|uniref:Fpg/Nei family DNA glycosylase n=1 Tax=Kocuria marina TaxID=223184 RepID=UPI00119EB927|nr:MULTISPECIES: zinc finger domain-containing protein [Kocuria]MCT2020231.1 Fpg/Nei family DNA glycosylase [Kocuria marina]